LRDILENLVFLTNADLEKIHYATLDVLEETGVRVDQEDALRLLNDAGAAVNFKERIVKIPRGLVEEVVKKAKRSVTLCGRNPKNDLKFGEGKVYVMTSSTGLKVLEMDTGEVRMSTKKDVADSARLADALDNLHIYSIMVDALDCPDEIMSLEEIDAMFNNTEKHIDTGTLSTETTRDAIRMAAAVAGGSEELRKRPIIDFMQTPVSPLIHDKGNTESILECAKHEIPLIILNMAQAGGTSPVTVAGTVLISNAEVLSGMLIAMLANPNVPLIYGTTSIVLNMSISPQPVFGLIESGLISTANAQLAKYYDFPCVIGADFGEATGHSGERTLRLGIIHAMLLALAKADVLYGPGLIEEAKTLSYEEMVIGNEVAGMILRGVRGIEVTEETLAKDLIHKVGPSGNFLSEKHTLEHLKKDFFIPELLNRKKTKNFMEGVRKKAKKILATHQPEPLDKNVKEQLRQIIKEAWKREQRKRTN
jgi:trimethylamine--corrinoid protein Co-methyltransferase